MRQDLQDPCIINILNDPKNKARKNDLTDIIITLPISVFCNSESVVFDEDDREYTYSFSDWNIPFLIKYSTCGKSHGYKHIPDINTLIKRFNDSSDVQKIMTFDFYFKYPAFECFP